MLQSCAYLGAYDFIPSRPPAARSQCAALRGQDGRDGRDVERTHASAHDETPPCHMPSLSFSPVTSFNPTKPINSQGVPDQKPDFVDERQRATRPVGQSNRTNPGARLLTSTKYCGFYRLRHLFDLWCCACDPRRHDLPQESRRLVTLANAR